LRLLLVDHHRLFRQGLARLLRDYREIEVVGEAGSGDEAVQKVRELRPEMVLMEVNLPVMDGLAALRAIRSESPSTKVVILTMSERGEDLMGALQAGAAGYVLKSTDFDALVRSIEGAAQGQAALSRELTARVLTHLSGLAAAPAVSPPLLAGRLSDREREIIKHLARGASNKQIARSLSLSEHTVRSHITSILQKLNAENRVQAAAYALQHGLA
jgi:two-component system, NarL family, nitrate/nitrite response regulator NarL